VEARTKEKSPEDYPEIMSSIVKKLPSSAQVFLPSFLPSMIILPSFLP
jgi:hypothetical protein